METPAFSSKAVESMNKAYAKACDVLKSAGADHQARLKTGERIMFLARNGVTDERTLCSQALREALTHLPPAVASNLVGIHGLSWRMLPDDCSTQIL